MRMSMQVALAAVLASMTASLAGPAAIAQNSNNNEPSQPPPAYNWGGFYGGGNLGGAFGGSDLLSSVPNGVPFLEGAVYPGITNPATPGIIAAYRSNDVNVRSFTGGLQAGYNFWTGGVLIGVEADINYLNAKSSKTTSALGSPGGFGVGLAPGAAATLYTFRSEIDANYIASLRARIGMPVGGVMLYATGGLALTTLKYNHSFRSSGGFFAGLTEDASASDTKVGWTVGGGAEVPLSRSVSLKAEYLFTAFGDVSTNDNKIFPLGFAGPPAIAAVADVACGANTGQGAAFFGAVNDGVPTPRQCFNHKADLFLHSLRLGLNFKF